MTESPRIVVIGGVAAGATAAAKARRTSENAHITLIEKGPHISYANCGLPYHVGGVIENRSSLLLHTPKSFGRRFNVDVLVNTEATAIDRERKTVTVTDDTGERTIPYDKLIIAVGAKTIVPPIDGINDVTMYTMRTVDDVDAINARIKAGAKHATVIGGGYIGVETVEALLHAGLSVTLVEAAPRILPRFTPEMSLAVVDEMESRNVTLKTGCLCTKVDEAGDGLSIHLKDGETFDTDMLVLATGVTPDVSLAKHAGLTIGEAGGITVNDAMQTSDPNIFAAGDVVEKKNRITNEWQLLPLAGPANREGRTAGANAAGGSMRFPGIIGTSICGFFDRAVASTGLTEEEARNAGFTPAVVYAENAHIAEYFPGHKFIFLKVIFDEPTGRILGAAASGRLGVDKRIDVIATAILGGLTIDDMEHFELTYAPQFGAAKDILNMAGFIGANQRRGEGFGITAKEYLASVADSVEHTLLDVRSRPEFKNGSMGRAVNVNIDELRRKIDQVPKDKPVYIFCAVGFRGYLATRMLRHEGYDAYNIIGGYEAIVRFQALNG